ncbi:MAG: FprA family A-type flavoprotein [Bacteroidales bacterium]|nr:FprA family A-type flavoprotein [Bacteroidales bacterium]
MYKISERIHYIGVNDEQKTLFEGLWPLPHGVSYNSYLIKDEKTALIDTVEHGFEDEFISNITSCINDGNIDYLVVNHMEPDHSSLISMILERYPDLKIIANAKTLPMLKGYHGVSEDRVKIVQEGESVSLGSCSLQFFMAPMVHWPETMVTWLPEENTLFSGDAFGTFGKIAQDPTDKAGTFDEFENEMRRYYSNIVGKYGNPVQSALKKLSSLEIKRICSTHGPIWAENIDKVVSLYDRLSRYETEKGVCIVYGSMYGNTATAAKELAKALENMGVPYALHDLAGNDSSREDGLGISGALMDVFKYDTIAVGSPTYNNGIFPPIETFMKALSARLIKNRRFFAFGSYTWAGASVRLLNGMASEFGFEILSDGGSFPQAFSKEKFNIEEAAVLLAGNK